MPRVLRTTRNLPKEVVYLAAFVELNGQGAPSYSSPVAFDADVVEQHMGSGWEFVTLRDGSTVRTPLTLYVDGDSTVVPREQDRVEVDSTPYIVVERTAPRGLRWARGNPDHYRLRLREE